MNLGGAPESAAANIDRMSLGLCGGYCSSKDEAEFVVRYILFHTNRFGSPMDPIFGAFR